MCEYSGGAITQSDEGSLGYVGEKRPGRGGRGTQEGGRGTQEGGGGDPGCVQERPSVCVCGRRDPGCVRGEAQGVRGWKDPVCVWEERPTVCVCVCV